MTAPTNLVPDQKEKELVSLRQTEIYNIFLDQGFIIDNSWFSKKQPFPFNKWERAAWRRIIRRHPTWRVDGEHGQRHRKLGMRNFAARQSVFFTDEPMGWFRPETGQIFLVTKHDAVIELRFLREESLAQIIETNKKIGRIKIALMRRGFRGHWVSTDTEQVVWAWTKIRKEEDLARGFRTEWFVLEDSAMRESDGSFVVLTQKSSRAVHDFGEITEVKQPARKWVRQVHDFDLSIRSDAQVVFHPSQFLKTVEEVERPIRMRTHLFRNFDMKLGPVLRIDKFGRVSELEIPEMERGIS
jgi:hypothetical protein